MSFRDSWRAVCAVLPSLERTALVGLEFVSSYQDATDYRVTSGRCRGSRVTLARPRADSSRYSLVATLPYGETPDSAPDVAALLLEQARADIEASEFHSGLWGDVAPSPFAGMRPVGLDPTEYSWIYRVTWRKATEAELAAPVAAVAVYRAELLGSV